MTIVRSLLAMSAVVCGFAQQCDETKTCGNEANDASQDLGTAMLQKHHMKSVAVHHGVAKYPVALDAQSPVTLYNLTAGGQKVKLDIPCAACRRAFTPSEQRLIDNCK